MANVIVFDAGVLIAYLDGDDAQHVRAEGLFAREIGDEFGANPLTLAEVLVVPARSGQLDQARAALRELHLQELPFPTDSAERLALLCADTGLRMPDCCVVLAAEAATARIASFDDRLTRAAAARNLAIVPR